MQKHQKQIIHFYNKQKRTKSVQKKKKTLLEEKKLHDERPRLFMRKSL